MLSHDTPLHVCVSLLQRRALIFLRMSCQLGFVYCFACVHPFLLKLTLVRSGGKIVIAVYPPATTSPRSNSAFSETIKPYHVPLRNVRCCPTRNSVGTTCTRLYRTMQHQGYHLSTLQGLYTESQNKRDGTLELPGSSVHAVSVALRTFMFPATLTHFNTHVDTR